MLLEKRLVRIILIAATDALCWFNDALVAAPHSAYDTFDIGASETQRLLDLMMPWRKAEVPTDPKEALRYWQAKALAHIMADDDDDVLPAQEAA